MGRILNFSAGVIQHHLIHDVLACQDRFSSVEKMARHLHSSDLMRRCRPVHFSCFESRVCSILLKHGKPFWQRRLTRRKPVPVSRNIWLDILAKQGKQDSDEEDEDSDEEDEDDDDRDGYIEEVSKEKDLEFVRICFDPDYNVQKKIDTDADADAAVSVADANTAVADADAAVSVADANTAVAVADADAAVSVAVADADAFMLLERLGAQPCKDLVGMDAVAVLKAGFFNVPFKMSRVLLLGPPGCAITNLAHSIANETPHVSFYQSSGASRDELLELFSKASTTTPSIVFFHDIDAVCVVDALMCMDMFHRPGSLLVIGATTRPHAINPGLISFGHFDCEIALAIPDENNPRVHILSVLARDTEKLSFTIPADFQKKIDTDDAADEDSDADAAVADADTAVSIAVADADAADAYMLLEGLDAQPCKDLVGMDAVAVLKAGFFNVPFKMSRVLLHGPPGCAITNLAHCIANETPQVSFYQSSGASQDELLELFSKASTTTPSIVFIHEIDAVCVFDVLMCMDMFHRPGSLLVIGATSKPHAINPGLMSFGHFDCEIALAIPDENNPRVHVLSVLAHEMEKLSITIPADFQVNTKNHTKIRKTQ